MIPALAAMRAQRGGARLVVLQNRLGASRQSLRTAVMAAVELDLIERNPGYGHPLRPEYLLTEAGQGVALACRRYADAVAAADAGSVGYRKWTAPILCSLSQGRCRYSEVESDLPAITPRALTSSLRSLCVAGLVVREIEDAYPPRAAYRPSEAGSAVARAAAGIAEALNASSRA